MHEIPTDDKPGFMAEEPVHCHACCDLIQPGQRYYLTIGQAAIFAGRIQTTDAIRVTDELAVVDEEGRLLVRRGDATVEVLPC